ncbi:MULTISPECIES: GNAT family N-acetyltransferase [unclassified Paenibacillus]|uniref:GNAT family N-acetyltransferase n=1 Tax=unclassified Paenibacillus TaxID=185978 RepID=UPI0009AE43A4|nr:MULTISPECIES: GNAT family N-acyltransferase [unclassified Paenibacillus]MBE1441819.1 putative hemolysin [Paenibacillus sp. OAS669]
MVQTAAQISPQSSNLSVKLATHSDELEQALRLRYQVFVEEEKNMRLLNDTGLEQDEYDTYCDHLIVKDMDLDQVVGTYRLLPGERALTANGFYSETEFDLSLFQEHKARSLELGRSCIDPAYRGGKAIQMLWEGIARYIADRDIQYLIGCASVHLHSLEELNLIYSMLRNKQVITDRFGIRPLPTHRIQGLECSEYELTDKELFRRLPPLMKGYQWLGAEIGGDPAYDELFDTVDFFIVLEKDRVTRKYRKHFSLDGNTSGE